MYGLTAVTVDHTRYLSFLLQMSWHHCSAIQSEPVSFSLHNILYATPFFSLNLISQWCFFWGSKLLSNTFCYIYNNVIYIQIASMKYFSLTCKVIAKKFLTLINWKQHQTSWTAIWVFKVYSIKLLNKNYKVRPSCLNCNSVLMFDFKSNTSLYLCRFLYPPLLHKIN